MRGCKAVGPFLKNSDVIDLAAIKNSLPFGVLNPGRWSVSANDHELGQFIPLVYHFNMLSDDVRMAAFKEAIAHSVVPGNQVLDLGGGTGVLSYFAAQSGASVVCVERNPELVRHAVRNLQANPLGERVVVVQADALDYLPRHPVDVVICEMLHVGMLKEKQIEVIHSFKMRYLKRFGNPLPRFIPEAFFLAVQPVQQSFDFHGFSATAPCFQDPLAIHPKTRELGPPKVYHSRSYHEPLSLDCSWRGSLEITCAGQFNAVRLITKNVLTVLEAEQRTVDWTNQYLVLPMESPVPVEAGAHVGVNLSYRAGAPISSLQPQFITVP